MWYEKDFHHHRRNFLSGEGRSDSTNRLVVAREDESDVPKNPARGIRSFLKKYLLQSSLHGARYVVEDELKLFERLIWACIMILSICAVTYINILLANRFNSSPLQTVIENVRYPVENILFPAVTICPEARVDWSRLEEAKEKFIPNATEDVQKLFGNFVGIQERTIENIYYDDPKYAVAKNETFQAFNSLNIREVFESVKNPCENILKDECWWGHKRFRCCDIFVPQKSELGFCYAFNSLVNDLGLTKWDENEPEWPARTSKYGPGSGLRIRHVGLEMTIIIHHPYTWPINGFFFDSDTSSQIALKPRVSYVTPSTSRYDPVSRGCILPDDLADPKYLNLPGLQYSKNNCLSECRQAYFVEKCNCTLETFFPIGNYKPCISTDVRGWFEKTAFFRVFFTIRDDYFRPDIAIREEQCACMPECDRLEYGEEFSPLDLVNDNSMEGGLVVDIYYQHGTMIKYRTEAVYEWLDLLVAFGGIGGLLMGASILSGVELIYYFTIGFFVYLRDQFGRMKTSKVKLLSGRSP